MQLSKIIDSYNVKHGANYSEEEFLRHFRLEKKYSIEKISLILNVDNRFISERIKHFCIDQPKITKRKIDEEKVIKLFKEGLTSKDIAIRFDADYKYVNRLLKPYRKKEFKQDVFLKISEDEMKNMTAKELASKLKTTENVIYYMASKFNRQYLKIQGKKEKLW